MKEEVYGLRYSGNLVFCGWKQDVQSRLEFGVIYFAGGDIFAGTTSTKEEPIDKIRP